MGKIAQTFAGPSDSWRTDADLGAFLRPELVPNACSGPENRPENTAAAPEYPLKTRRCPDSPEDCASVSALQREPGEKRGDRFRSRDPGIARREVAVAYRRFDPLPKASRRGWDGRPDSREMFGRDVLGECSGEMAERSKAHAWKACVGQPTVGSNPTLSAISRPIRTSPRPQVR